MSFVLLRWLAILPAPHFGNHYSTFMQKKLQTTTEKSKSHDKYERKKSVIMYLTS